MSSSLDIGLYFVELLTDAGTWDRIAERIDYPHYCDDTGIK